jgi:hypothetical protein
MLPTDLLVRVPVAVVDAHEPVLLLQETRETRAKSELVPPAACPVPPVLPLQWMAGFGMPLMQRVIPEDCRRGPYTPTFQPSTTQTP